MILKKTIFASAFLSMTFLVGCENRVGFWSSSEAKINAAYPVLESVNSVKAALLNVMTDPQRTYIESQFASRLKLRALNCAKGYSPSWHTSGNEIRMKLGGSQCFAEYDIEFRKWLGIYQAGLILAKPALKMPLAQAPSFLVADAFINATNFASNAAVALLGTEQSSLIIDMETEKPIYKENKGANAVGRAVGNLSPNGRLFIASDNYGSQLKIKESESGNVIAEMSNTRSTAFTWLDNQTAIYKKGDNQKTYVIDFTTGTEVPVNGINNAFDRAVKVPGVENQYVVFAGAGASVSKIELVRSQPEASVKLIAEKRIADSMSCSSNTSDLSADGKHFYCLSSRKLVSVSLDTLEFETVSLDPFYIQTLVATPDPDKILLSGYINPPQGDGAREYLYSVGNQTITPIDRAKGLSQRFVYINSLKKQAVINGSKVEVLSELPVLETVSVQKFVANAQEQVNQRKIAELDKQTALLNGVVISGSLPQAVTKVLAVGPLAELSKNAQIEGVGVYKGGAVGAQSANVHKMGNVEVRVRRSSKPVVLVLSSYEPVRWMLITESGAKLAAVLVSGYYPSVVVGAGTAPITVTGSTYAYKQDSTQFRALNLSIANLTGKEIGLFQGRYEGGSFSVGGY